MKPVSKYKPLFITLGVFAVLILLFALPGILNSKNSLVTGPWASADVGCVNEALTLAQHFHPNLKIVVDGKDEEVSANIGITPACAAEIHTHTLGPDDSPGTLHVETPFAGRTFRLKQFFAVWGETIEREGYSAAMTVDGKPNTELGELVLTDKQQIVLVYTKQ